MLNFWLINFMINFVYYLFVYFDMSINDSVGGIVDLIVGKLCIL